MTEGGGHVPENGATIDHLRSRNIPNREQQPEKWVPGITVLACGRCNNLRGKHESAFLRELDEELFYEKGNARPSGLDFASLHGSICSGVLKCLSPEFEDLLRQTKRGRKLLSHIRKLIRYRKLSDSRKNGSCNSETETTLTRSIDMKTRWKRDTVEQLLQDGTLTFAETSPGGDWDLRGFRITAAGAAPNEHVMVVPFLDPNGPDASSVDHDDCEVYALEVQSWNCDSRGGCQTKDIPTASAYGVITAKLRTAGFAVIGHYDEIF